MQYYKKTTKKLFFGKYVNKVAIRIPVARYFRGNKLEKTGSDIATLNNKFNNRAHQQVQVGGSWSRSYASIKDIQIANEIIAVLKSLSSYAIRVDSSTLGVYSNDIDFINKITAIKDIHIEETSQAADDKIKEFLLTTPKAIIRKEYTHKYKVTVNALWDSASSFTTWADKLPKIKTTRNSYQFGGYFYVADEKTLSLCHIFLSDKVRKVEELVTSEEI
jgi:hypothetical protein